MAQNGKSRRRRAAEEEDEPEPEPCRNPRCVEIDTWSWKLHHDNEKLRAEVQRLRLDEGRERQRERAATAASLNIKRLMKQVAELEKTIERLNGELEESRMEAKNAKLQVTSLEYRLHAQAGELGTLRSKFINGGGSNGLSVSMPLESPTGPKTGSFFQTSAESPDAKSPAASRPGSRPATHRSAPSSKQRGQLSKRSLHSSTRLTRGNTAGELGRSSPQPSAACEHDGSPVKSPFASEPTEKNMVWSCCLAPFSRPSKGPSRVQSAALLSTPPSGLVSPLRRLDKAGRPVWQPPVEPPVRERRRPVPLPGGLRSLTRPHTSPAT